MAKALLQYIGRELHYDMTIAIIDGVPRILETVYRGEKKVHYSRASKG